MGKPLGIWMQGYYLEAGLLSEKVGFFRLIHDWPLSLLWNRTGFFRGSPVLQQMSIRLKDIEY